MFSLSVTFVQVGIRLRLNGGSGRCVNERLFDRSRSKEVIVITVPAKCRHDLNDQERDGN